MIEGLKDIINDVERKAWAEKFGDIVTTGTSASRCGRSLDRSRECYRIKGHPGTQHAYIDYYREHSKDYPHGSVIRIWFENKEAVQ